MGSVNEYIEANKRHWDEAVALHVASDFYDVEEFRRNPDRLKPIELKELGDVRGKTLLHLQCHFGIDTISWARQGAIVTGVDFAGNAVAQARTLAAEIGVDARFVESSIYELPSNLDATFDIVFTSYGVLTWLPDLKRWAEVVAHFLKPGGTFYIVEFHPVAWIFDDAPEVDDLHVKYPYFAPDSPLAFEYDGTYAATDAKLENRLTYDFPHPVGETVTSLIDAGLRIDFLHEFPFSTYQFLPFTEQRTDGKVYLTKHDGCVPLLYSIKATKPA
ncbi:MAG TPA: class I SAM-dependent methyltransferase [Dehalococcoidia bacterium]